MATKIISVSPSGRVRRTTAVKQSTDSRIKQIVRELNLDYETYKRQAKFRLLTNLSNHQFLGIN